jgi:acyl-CoA dehydrogenase
VQKGAFSREAFGKPLAELGANYDIIANARIDIEMTRLLCLKAAWMMDTAGVRAAQPWISKIKVQAPLMALKVVDDAMQVHGATGISQDTPLAAIWTDLGRCASPMGRTRCTAARSRGRSCASTRTRRHEP